MVCGVWYVVCDGEVRDGMMWDGVVYQGVPCGKRCYGMWSVMVWYVVLKLVNQFSTVILLVLHNESRSICLGKIKDITYPFFKSRNHTQVHYGHHNGTIHYHVDTGD